MVRNIVQAFLTISLVFGVADLVKTSYINMYSNISLSRNPDKRSIISLGLSFGSLIACGMKRDGHSCVQSVTCEPLAW